MILEIRDDNDQVIYRSPNSNNEITLLCDPDALEAAARLCKVAAEYMDDWANGRRRSIASTESATPAPTPGT